MSIQRIIKARLRTYCCSGKPIIITYFWRPDVWACAHGCASVALLIQHAIRMRHIVTSFVTPLAPPYFSTLSHKRHDFRKKVIEHKMCVLIFCTTFVQNISHSTKNLARYCHKCENVFISSACCCCQF
jgi:hypothetical protein